MACCSPWGRKESDSTERLNKNRSYHNPEAKLLLPKRVGSASLLQGIFPTQGSNPGLPHFRRILYQLSHWGSPIAKQRKPTVRKVPGLQTSPPRHSTENGVGDKKSPPEQATEFCSAQFSWGASAEHPTSPPGRPRLQPHLCLSLQQLLHHRGWRGSRSNPELGCALGSKNSSQWALGEAAIPIQQKHDNDQFDQSSQTRLLP